MKNEIVVTFTWPAAVDNLLPTEINRILGEVAGQLSRAANKSIETAVFEFNGKTHTVPLKAYTQT